MTNNNKDINETKHSTAANVSKNVVKFIGYFWIVLSVIIAIWQLIDFLFQPNPFQLNSYVGWIIGAVVLIVSGVLAGLLTRFFPSILEAVAGIFDKRREEEKYFKVSYVENDTLASTIFESLPYIDDDKFLLTSLKNSCFSKNLNYENALNIARANGTLLYRLGKNYLRVLNGMYALYAVEKWLTRRKKRYTYYKNYFIINDIGWSLTTLSDHYYSELKKFLSNSSDGQLIYKTIKDVVNINLNDTARKNGENLIKSAREELEDGDFPKLYAQATRHCRSFNETGYALTLKKGFEKAIKKIKNKDDRSEVRGHMKFLEAVLTFEKENASPVEIENALKDIETAQNEYTKIKDMARAVKCYNLKGKLLLKKKDNDAAKIQFEDGLKESKKFQRFDQVLLNLESLTMLENNPEKKKQYAREGLTLAIELKNPDKEDYFNQFAPMKHIFIVRHGESEKNLVKTISGEGALTDIGKEQIKEKCESLQEYLKKKKYKSKDIRVYGTHKKQIEESMNLIISSENISSDNIFYEDNLLKPLYMGILSGKPENEPNADKKMRDALIVLNQWRNGMISAQGLTKISGIEPFDSYWARAQDFIDNKIKDDTVSIVVCTTSVAVFLTQYLINPNMTDSEYYCLDIPLGAVIHFTDIPNKNEYRLMNRDTRTNILYSSIQSNSLIAGCK